MYIKNHQACTDKNELFYYLLFLTSFFILLEISFFAQSNKAYLADFTFVAHHLTIPLSIAPSIIFFIAAQLLVHVMYCVTIWWLTLSIARLFTVRKIVLSGISFWLLGMATVIFANEFFLPNSKFSELVSVVFSPALSSIIFVILLTLFLGLLAIAVLYTAWRYARWSIVLSSTTIIIYWGYPAPHYKDAGTVEKPNIIIIGIDALRPDFLSYFGGDTPTPFLDGLLNQSTVFAQAITPIARTFPSWISVLTGEYPKESGIRFDLAANQLSHPAELLPMILKQHHYETIFATDESRFSNIDNRFGFDKTISPPVGLNDFLLGTFNDFPLTNLLVNTKIGRWLFPYSYANRAASITYQPNSFLKLIAEKLPKERNKPLFIALHFCLPHYPYLWANLRASQYTFIERYNQSLMEVDRQVQGFFVLLTQYQLLQHAIVVVLSDHGEALELNGDRITENDLFISGSEKHVSTPVFYPPSQENEAINQSAGHGTDVLGLSQYHSLLAFTLFGTGKAQPGLVTPVVSLVDIKPTILDLIRIAYINSPYTQSLAGFVTGETSRIANQHHFLESDFSPVAVRTLYPEIHKVLLEGIDIFQIDPVSTRLTVRSSMGQMIINSKQYADIYGEWMLALYPQDKYGRMPILVNLTTGRWTNNLNSTFAHQSPAQKMLTALKSFYQAELGSILSYR